MRHLMLSVVLSSFSIAAGAQTGPAPAPAIAEPKLLETVLVQGTQPGPRLWRVTRDDHTLWILGTLRPLPKQMTWASQEVDAIIAQSGEVLAPGRAKPKIGAGDMLKMAMLTPSAMKSIKNPDGARLKEVLPPALYARWELARQRHMPDDRQVDRHRPTAAAIELYYGAIDSAGLTTANIAWNTISESAKRHGTKVTDTGVSFAIDIDRKKMKVGIKALSELRPDIACFTETLDRLDPDLAAMKIRANAWARGDLDVLRLVDQEDLQSPCLKLERDAMAFMQKPELESRLELAWLAAAQSALTRHRTSFASLPMEEILKPKGYLSRLRSLGYAVHEPDEQEIEDDGSD